MIVAAQIFSMLACLFFSCLAVAFWSFNGFPYGNPDNTPSIVITILAVVFGILAVTLMVVGYRL